MLIKVFKQYLTEKMMLEAVNVRVK